MRNKRQIKIHLLFVIGFFFFLTYGCEKDVIEEKPSKKVPTLTWANPDDILVYTSLISTQLNATSNIPGVFVYTPSIGEVMTQVGPKELIVHFTPNDTLSYSSISKTVTLNVVEGSIFNSKLNYGSMTDQDGNTYKTITIGSQTWMAENLKTTKYNDGSDIPNINGTEWESIKTPAFWWFENNSTNKNVYGALYNWHTIYTGKLAPNGWHIPTEAEWTKLEDYLIANGFNFDGTSTGDRTNNNKTAKALASTTGWYLTVNEGATGSANHSDKRNATGFSARPCGYTPPKLHDGLGYFTLTGAECIWWSATEKGNDSSYIRYLSHDKFNMGKTSEIKHLGLSIRCIKD